MGLERKDILSLFGMASHHNRAGLGLRRPCLNSGQASQAEPRRGALRFARSDPCLVSQQGLARYTSCTQTKRNSKKLFKSQIKLEKKIRASKGTWKQLCNP